MLTPTQTPYGHGRVAVGAVDLFRVVSTPHHSITNSMVVSDLNLSKDELKLKLRPNDDDDDSAVSQIIDSFSLGLDSKASDVLSASKVCFKMGPHQVSLT